MADPEKPGPTERQPTLGHRVQYLAYRVGLGLLRWIPEPLSLAMGEGLGWFVGVVLGVRRKVVREHLQLAFSQKDEAWRRRILRASFRHVGREAVATFLLGRMTREEVIQRSEVEGLEALQEAVAEGRGVVLVTGHLGNWEMGGASLAARGIPLDAVAQRQRNPLFHRDITKNRENLGMKVILRGHAPREVLRSLRRGRVAALVADQNAKRSELFVDFFGRKAATARGAAVFALRTGSPIFLGRALRVKGSRARYHLKVSRVDFQTTGDPEKDAIRLTETHTQYLEEEIRKAPEQYFWQHRRWKTRPPEEGDE